MISKIQNDFFLSQLSEILSGNLSALCGDPDSLQLGLTGDNRRVVTQVIRDICHINMTAVNEEMRKALSEDLWNLINHAVSYNTHLRYLSNLSALAVYLISLERHY